MVTSRLPGEGQSLDMAPLVRQIRSLESIGAQVELLEIKGARRVKYLTSIPALRRRARSVDVIHAHYGYCGWLARTSLSKPIVCSFMGDDLLGSPDENGDVGQLSKLIVRSSRLLARMIDAVIVKSVEMAAVVAPTSAYVIPNGVDMDMFAPLDTREARAALGWSDDRRYILFPGNPDNPRKGFRLAESAVEHASRLVSDRMELIRLRDVPPDRVPLYMNACDVMLMTSYIEGSPNVVKEAMSCNRPVVSVPVGDVGELFEPADGNALCPRDPQALGVAVAEVLERADRSQGRAVLQQKGLDLESVAKRIVRVYEDVVQACITDRPAAKQACGAGQQSEYQPIGNAND